MELRFSLRVSNVARFINTSSFAPGTSTVQKSKFVLDEAYKVLTGTKSGFTNLIRDHTLLTIDEGLPRPPSRDRYLSLRTT